MNHSHGRITVKTSEQSEEERKRKHVRITAHTVRPLPRQLTVAEHNPVRNLWPLPSLVRIELRDDQQRVGEPEAYMK